MHETIDISNDKLLFAGRRWITVSAAVGVIGLAGAVAVAAISDGGWHRLAYSYLMNYCYVLSIALGALFFVILQHLTRAHWSVTVRRIAEGTAGTLPVMAALFVPILLAMGTLYHWSHADAVAQDAILQGKRAYLNPAAFSIRAAVYFLIWIALSQLFLRRSLRQDQSGDPRLTSQMERLSPVSMILFGFTITFAAFDFLMSLDPHWFSSIYGIYYFSGAFVGAVAFLTVAVMLVQRAGYMRHAVHIEHYHDLGKLLFAFTVFWAYIAFSQYLLIWYANMPEETAWYLRRQTGQWTAVSLLLLFGHFLLPFAALMSRHPKRRRPVLLAMAIWMLAMHWVDIYWLVMPEISPGTVPLHVMDLFALAGLAGLFVAGVAFRLNGRPLVPVRDPRLQDSLAFESA